MLKEFFDTDTLFCVEDKAVSEEVVANFSNAVRELRRLLRVPDYFKDASSVLPVLAPGWLTRDHFNNAAA